jgi:hypothetical protein
MTHFKIIFHAALLALLCTAGSRAQTANGTTAAPSGDPQPQAQNVPVTLTWDYYAPTKTLVFHATNNSGKEIAGYYISIQYRLRDGTWDKPGLWGSVQDMMDMIVSIQMAKDPASYEHRMQEQGLGPFAAGTTRDVILHSIDSGDVKATADPIFYTDGTFEKQDENEFKRFLSRRQGELLGNQEAIKIVRAALADPTNEHPIADAIPELAKAAAEEMVHNPDGPYDIARMVGSILQGNIAMLRVVQDQTAKNTGTPSEMGKTERERVIQYVERLEKRVELMTPQCHLEIALKQ